MTIISTINQTTNRLKQLWRSALMVALLALICTTLPTAQANPGDLDKTFAGFQAGGFALLAGLKMYVPEDDNANGMVLQPDGKIVMVGESMPALRVFRYLPNGEPDTTFGFRNGEADVQIPRAGMVLHPNDVALQSDGKIVVVGRTTLARDDDNGDFLLVRLTTSGKLDLSFGIEGGGFVTTNFSGNQDAAFAVLIQPDDKIIACGHAYIGGDYDFAVARYLPDGAPDTSFSGDGKATIGFGGDEGCHNIARQSDGKVILVGNSDNDFAVARLNSNGSPDTDNDGYNDGNFGGDGQVTTDFGKSEKAWDVTIQPDAKIVVLGNSLSPNGSYIARYMPNGAPDETFGPGGKRTIPDDSLFDLALQPDGKLLVLGFHKHAYGDRDFAFHRLNPDGTPDRTFGDGGDGNILHDFSGQEVGRALALLPDGRIMGFGRSGEFTLLLVRLWPDGALDRGGQQTHALAHGLNESGYALAIQPDGSLLVAGEVNRPNNAPGSAFVTRFHNDGQVDTDFGVRGTIQTPTIGSTTGGARAIALQADGKIVIAGHRKGVLSSSTEDFLIARWNSNGTVDNNFGVVGFRTVPFPGNGDDYATALALAPAGKIVVAGSVWNGVKQVWGVARLTSAGDPDSTFDGDGLVTFELSGNSAINAVAIQPDGKVLVAGYSSENFAVARLMENGSPDPSFGQGGFAINDLGGTDIITALALAPNGWIYAAGYRSQNNQTDMALAQYTPEGLFASCPDPANCYNWPNGTFFVHLGSNNTAYALDLRGDNQLVAAGCTNQHFAAVQVRTDGSPTPRLFNTDFVGGTDCARAVRFSRANGIVLAGSQYLAPITNDTNIALTRFETIRYDPVPTPTPSPTPSPTSSVYSVYLPIIMH